MDLKSFLQNLPNLPGVYSMQDKHSNVIYIGKAKDLKNRIKSYFYSQEGKNFNPKTNALVAEIANIEITVTQNEIEALLLENKLINQFKPKYNIIFRDDKSYPYILITNEEFPSLRYWRGKINKKTGELYGPYPSNQSVKVSLDLLYKIFKLRSCDPVTFKNRVRPCLEYQLQRCSAPCVGLINQDSYAKDLASVKLFLQAKSRLLIKDLTLKMNQAAISLDYEAAAKLRDQIKALKLLQNEQAVLNKKVVDVDVIGIAVSPKLICIHLLRIRQGDLLYSRQFFSKNVLVAADLDSAEFLVKFIMQNYMPNAKKQDLTVQLPESKVAEILTTIALKNATDLEKILNIKISCAKSGDRLAWQEIAKTSAEESLTSRVAEYRKQKNNFKLLTNLLGKKNIIERIACFDISHTQGKEAISACVVFNVFGKEKSSYRLFNITTSNPGDDYQALEIAISKYLERVIAEIDLAPDLLIVDGGKGQLGVAEKVLNNFKLASLGKINLTLLSIAKGKDRIKGKEKFYLTSAGDQLSLSPDSPVFKLLQRIRDATHNFAITSHRRKRDKIIKV